MTKRDGKHAYRKLGPQSEFEFQKFAVETAKKFGSLPPDWELSREMPAKYRRWLPANLAARIARDLDLGDGE